MYVVKKMVVVVGVCVCARYGQNSAVPGPNNITQEEKSESKQKTEEGKFGM